MSVGTQIAGYRLEEVVGRGGMGVVYRAHDVALERSVALKLLAPRLAEDPAFRERFLVETRLAASLDHPNVVPIYDAGEADGQLYLAMRYVEGTDLKRLLQEKGTLEPARAIAICTQVADALDAAHASGLVHRDVKPSNVLLDEREHAYLADFGLTRRLSEQVPAFEAGLSLGTPAYVAPEQIEGKEVDGRADQYSLACMLCECLTGKPPFPRGSEAATLFAHLEEAPPAPPGLEQVMAKALAKDPAERYESCSAFVIAARSALGLEPRRTRWPLAVAGVGAALIGAALLAFLLTRGGGVPLPGDVLVRIDPRTSRVVERLTVGRNPSVVAADEDGVWVANHDDGSVWRIDSATNQVRLRSPAHGTPADLAVSAGQAVVANGPGDSSVAIVNGLTGAASVISLAVGAPVYGTPRVAAGASGIWVARPDRLVGRLDTDAGKLVDPLLIPSPRDERADSFFSGIAVGEGGIWVIGDPLDPTLWRIDPATGNLDATIRLPFAPTDVAVGAGAVWVTSQLDDIVSRIDPKTNEITATVPAGKGVAGVAVGAGSVWVADTIGGTVTRIDPTTLRVTDAIDVGSSPDDVAVGAGGVWVGAKPTAAPKRSALKIGVLADCEGIYGFAGDPSYAGAELPLIRRGARPLGSKPADGVSEAEVAGRNVQLFLGCGDDTAEKALAETRRLIEDVGVDVLIGPLQIGESLAVREYARRHLQTTFVDGTAAGQSLTLRDPAPNFFRFSTDGAQFAAGVGTYAYRTLGWRQAVTVATGEAFEYTQVAGFVAEFCALGGRITKRIWSPEDVLRYVARGRADGFFVANPAGFDKEFRNLPENLSHRIVGGIEWVSPPAAKAKRWLGTAFGSPTAPGSGPAWIAYISSFREAFPALARVVAAAVFPIEYYDAVEATLQALEQVDGDLSGSQRRFRAALASVDLDSPVGRIRLDRRHQAIAPNFLSQWQKGAGGKLVLRTIRVIPDVEQTFGGYFRPNGPMPSRTYPPCRKGDPPRWAR